MTALPNPSEYLSFWISCGKTSQLGHILFGLYEVLAQRLHASTELADVANRERLHFIVAAQSLEDRQFLQLAGDPDCISNGRCTLTEIMKLAVQSKQILGHRDMAYRTDGPFAVVFFVAEQEEQVWIASAAGVGDPAAPRRKNLTKLERHPSCARLLRSPVLFALPASEHKRNDNCSHCANSGQRLPDHGHSLTPLHPMEPILP